MSILENHNLRSISEVLNKTEEMVDFSRGNYWHYYRPRSKGKKEKFLLGSYFIVGRDMWLLCPKGVKLPKAVKDFALLLAYYPRRARDKAHYFRLLRKYNGGKM